MPVEVPIVFKDFTQGEFRGIAYDVVGHAIGVLRELGQLVDEAIGNVVMPSAGPNTMFRLTAVNSSAQPQFEVNAHNLLSHSALDQLLWANIRHDKIRFQSMHL